MADVTPEEGHEMSSAYEGGSERHGLTGGGPTNAKPEKHHVADDDWGTCALAAGSDDVWVTAQPCLSQPP
jgi:hypothetical protein